MNSPIKTIIKNLTNHTISQPLGGAGKAWLGPKGSGKDFVVCDGDVFSRLGTDSLASDLIELLLENKLYLEYCIDRITPSRPNTGDANFRSTYDAAHKISELNKALMPVDAPVKESVQPEAESEEPVTTTIVEETKEVALDETAPKASEIVDEVGRSATAEDEADAGEEEQPKKKRTKRVKID